MKSIALFAVASAALIAGFAWVLGLVFVGAADHHAIRVSATVAFVVQLFSFAVARVVAQGNVMAGWGLGMLLRLATLVVYAFAITKAFGLPPAAALMSLATFLFVSTLIEPVLLKS